MNKLQTNSKPAYLTIYEKIKEDIKQGVYHYGKKIPSKRTMSDKMDVSVITTEHAYALLSEEGYIESRERSGYFVLYRQEDFYNETPVQKKEIKVANYELPDSTISYSLAAKAMRKVILDKGDSILIKSPNKGHLELRQALSEYLSRTQSIYAEPERIIIGAGAEYLYILISQLLSGEKFIIENPCYEKIEKVYNSCGTGFEKVNLYHDGLNLKDLYNTDATVLHCTPFNSYPSGISASILKRMEYLRWAKDRQGYIIEDNFDSELTILKKNEDSIFSLSDADNVIYLNTYSKTIAPSIRLGYMILPEKLLKVFDEKLSFYSCTVPTYDQYVLTELINSGDFERHINRVRRAKRKAIKSV